MKLFVYCPEQYSNQEDSPEWQIALELSKDSKLPIISNLKIFEHMDKPQLVSIPEKQICDIQKVVESGFIHSIDLINEFYEIDKSLVACFTNKEGVTYQEAPILREKHKAKFRVRHNQKGEYTVIIRDSQKEYYSGSFEVL
jgi:hypothetical protein